MSDSTPARPLSLREVLAPAGRRWRTAVAVTGIVLVGTVAFGQSRPVEYTATSTLTVSPITLDPLSSPASTQAINITTERAVLGSTEVARIAAETLGDVSAQALDGSSSVEAPSGSQVLSVTVSARSPQAAADRANALAQAYLTFRSQGAVEMAKGRLDDVTAQIAQAEQSGSTQGLSELRDEARDLSQIGANPGRIIGIATVPTSPSSLSLLSYVMLGLVGGALLGLALAFVRDILDRRIRFASKLGAITGSEGYVVRERDLEGFRWLFREIRSRFTANRTRPVVVSVFATPPARAEGIIAGLSTVARSAGIGVRVVGSEEVAAEQLDAAWKLPGGKGEGRTLVIVDGRGVKSDAHRATVADGSDVAILVASAGSRKAEVRNLLASLERASVKVLTAFVLPVRKQDTRPDPTRVTETQWEPEKAVVAA